MDYREINIRIPRFQRFPSWLLPSPGNVIFTLVVVIALFWAQSAGAIPLLAQESTDSSISSISYQGRLADASGNPLTGTYGMIFRLYNASSGGTPLWEEQWTGPNSVEISDGLFNILLGSLNPISQSIVTTTGNLWLGITVGADDEMSPRVQLGSVPYSVQAFTVSDGSISTEKLSIGAVTHDRQTVRTYHDQDDAHIQVQGLVTDENPAVISQFQFEDVPAGDVDVLLTLIGFLEPGKSGAGKIWIEPNGGTRLDYLPTHLIFDENAHQLTLHGRIQNFAGGTLTISLKADTENSSVNLHFGANNGDTRFGRRITIIAGL